MKEAEMTNEETLQNLRAVIKAAQTLRKLENERNNLPNTYPHWIDDRIEAYWEQYFELEAQLGSYN